MDKKTIPISNRVKFRFWRDLRSNEMVVTVARIRHKVTISALQVPEVCQGIGLSEDERLQIIAKLWEYRLTSESN
jgi:hypothetical protein